MKDSPDILFVVPSYSPQLNQESLGTLLLTKIVLNAGYNASIIRYWQIDFDLKDYSSFSSKFLNYLYTTKPKILSFYCRSSEYHICIDLAIRVKKELPSIKIVLGGPQAALSAYDTLSNFPEIDYVCCGEGESTIVPLVELITEKKREQKQIRGLVYRESGEIIKNQLPDQLPDDYSNDYDYLDLIPTEVINKSSDCSIDVGRGCPFSCTFCSTKVFWERNFRLRDIDNTINEIEYVISKTNIKNFSFEHDLFTSNKQRVLIFSRTLINKSISINWSCSSRIDTIDKEMIDVMISAGLSSIYFGIESGSSRIQKMINKNIKIEKCFETISYAISKGLYVTTSFMYGFPEENYEDIEDTLVLIHKLRKLGVKNIQLHRLSIENGTTLYDVCKERLIFDSINNCNIFGYEDLKNLISQYPSVFCSFYNFRTKLRDTLCYVDTFHCMCSAFSNQMNKVIDLFDSKNVKILELYQVFCDANYNHLVLFEKRRIQISKSLPILYFLYETFLYSILKTDSTLKQNLTSSEIEYLFVLCKPSNSNALKSDMHK